MAATVREHSGIGLPLLPAISSRGEEGPCIAQAMHAFRLSMLATLSVACMGPYAFNR
jgi:hypothetical protein